MRAAMMALLVTVVTVVSAGPLCAQTERGYITGFGGLSTAHQTTSGDILGEAGVGVAPHLLVFGDLGRFQNLQTSDIQPAVDNTTTLLSDQGLSVTPTTRMPAWYSVAGLRYDVQGG